MSGGAPLSGLACLVLAHDNPQQLLLLLRRLSREGATTWLHLDIRAEAVRSQLAGALPPRTRLLPRLLSQRIDWGGFAMVEASLTLMREALAEPGTRHLCLLSGAHLPLRPGAEIADFLFDGRQHMELRFAAAEPPERESLRRFWHRGLAGREAQAPLVRLANRQAWRLGKRDLARGLRGMTPMVGSQWWHMTAECGRHLLRFLDENPWYSAFFRHARIPDESFFHTLLGHSPYAAALGEPCSWQSMEGYSPRLLGVADIPEALASGRPFARKFDLRQDPLAVRMLPVHGAAAPARPRSLPRGRPMPPAPPPLPDGLRPTGPEPRPRPGEILALLVVRNEALRLPATLRHLRRLGVDRALLVDNLSEDGTLEIAAQHDWVQVIRAPGSYAASNFGVTWTNDVLDRYARGHWVLVVDADELLVYPGCETRDLHALCAHLDSIGAEALPAPLLDCFPEGPLNALDFGPEAELLDIAPWFEPAQYRREACADFPHAQLYGGLRERLFFPEADPARPGRLLRQKLYNLGWRLPPLRQAGWFRALAPKRSPNLMKVPLLRWREGARLLSSTHLLAPMHLAEGQPTGMLLHFKFLQDFHARALDAVARGAHYDGSREYRRYLAALVRDPGFRLHGPRSLRYEGPEQLVALGLMQDSPAWRTARAGSRADARSYAAD